MSCKHTTNTSNTQEKPQKMMQFYHKNPCKRVVLALFSEHLSALYNYNILIYNMLKLQADSDRCFSTFIFFVICRKRLHDDVLHISKLLNFKSILTIWGLLMAYSSSTFCSLHQLPLPFPYTCCLPY